MNSRDEYIDVAKRKLDEWKIDLEHMENNMHRAGEDLQLKSREEMVTLRKKWTEAKAHLERLQDSGEDNWEKVKQGAENTWDSLKEGVEKIKNKFQ